MNQMQGQASSQCIMVQVADQPAVYPKCPGANVLAQQPKPRSCETLRQALANLTFRLVRRPVQALAFSGALSGQSIGIFGLSASFLQTEVGDNAMDTAQTDGEVGLCSFVQSPPGRRLDQKTITQDLSDD
jgi:hypothetical protein